MILALLIGCVLICLALATVAAQPVTDRSRRRSQSRRARFVAAHPTHVNSADIVAGLHHEGLSPSQARFVTDHALAQGIKPFTMWLWLEQFGAEAFSIVVAADLTQSELLLHISNGSVPDMEELTLFASANGLDLHDSHASGTHRSGAAVRAGRRPPMRPSFEPGAPAALAGRSRTRGNPRATMRGPGGRGDLAA